MKLRLAVIATTMIVAGCGTSETVKGTGVVWEGTVAARYDQLANCLSTQTTLYYKSSIQFDRRERRATVTFAIPVTGIPVEVYDVREVSPEATQVSWSSRLERGRQQGGKAYYLLHQCGATPLPVASTAPPAPARAAPLPSTQEPNWAPEPDNEGQSDR